MTKPLRDAAAEIVRTHQSFLGICIACVEKESDRDPFEKAFRDAARNHAPALADWATRAAEVMATMLDGPGDPVAWVERARALRAEWEGRRDG